jgi:hypothetical protein
MNNARRDGLYLFILGSLVFALLGGALESTTAKIDFKMVYYSARCLLQHGDPYQQSDVMRVYLAEGADAATESMRDRQNVTRFVYFPTLFSWSVPFALLPFGLAHFLWMVLTIAAFILAAFLVWSRAAQFAPLAAGALIGWMLANSALPLILGNPAGIAISLCVIGTCLLLGERLVLAGVVCLALSLVIKPHDAGLVWLYFVLAGGAYRKRALQTLVVALVLCLPAILWVTHVAPHWATEQRATILTASAHGGPDDPGPASKGAHALGMMVNLQTAISLLRDNPHFYNPVTYGICGLLLAFWIAAVLRSSSAPTNAWLALASVAALTLLPFYHRQSDTKLLLLAIPACAMLYAQKGLTGRVALVITTVGVVLTGEIPWALLVAVINKFQMPTTGFAGEMMTAVQIFPVPLILLTIAVFYLWICWRRGEGRTEAPAAQ